MLPITPPDRTPPMRALIYARFSTTLQSSLSIDDQVRTCTDRATAEGWPVASVHADAAISGAVRERPGLNALLAELGPGDIFLSESLDRISRDQEDIAAIFKRVGYIGARIVTLSEGEVGAIHVGLRGTMAAMQRQDIADKVRRGLTGRALAGSNPGGMAYGYRKVPKLDARGEPVRGLRQIDPEQAAVVRRIFDDFTGGQSARSIAETLNREGIPGPTGGLWRGSTINGDPKRRNGILRNDLYRGLLIYNITRRIYHPVTRRREIRLNPESQWLRSEVPELRIVSEEQWRRAGERQRDSAQDRPERARRPKRLLSGKAVCGLCGSQWRVIAGDRWGCGAHFDGRACVNGRSITTAAFERRVLAGLSDRLLDPELVAIYVDEWRSAEAERRRGAGRERSRIERRQADAERKVARLVMALTDDRLSGMEELAVALAAARRDRDDTARALAELANDGVVTLHPGLADDYRRQMGNLVEALQGADRAAARDALRTLIAEIVVTPKAEGRGVAIEVSGLLANILTIATGNTPKAMYWNDGAPGGPRSLPYTLLSTAA